jgi:hypothetical protein
MTNYIAFRRFSSEVLGKFQAATFGEAIRIAECRWGENVFVTWTQPDGY